MPASTEARRKGQPNRMTLDKFIEKARAVHGDKYDYSQVEYVNTKTKVTIICPLHGPFQQTPEKHFSGCGCPGKACVAEKHRENSQKKFGVDHWSQAQSVKEKKERTMLDKHGVKNPMQVQEFREKQEAACLQSTGAVSPLASPMVREKIQVTMQKKHGGNGAMCDPEVREKARQTNLRRRGVENAMQDESVRQAQQDTLERNYGVRNPMQASELQQKQRESQKVTMTDKYGADSGFGSPVLREKSQETCFDKYGARNVMQLKAFVDKMTASKIANGTTSTSATEDALYEQLCQVFGQDDVIRQYRSDRYPYACDFYIKSRDMFMELNAGWPHDDGWFEDRPNDERLNEIIEKSQQNDFYKSVLHTWTKSDVAKRACARDGGLNYVVFWDNQLRDAALWFALGMPDGRDYERIYSWLPERESWAFDIPELTGGWQNLSAVAKAYQSDVFYGREKAMWAENPMYRETYLRVWLYHNRLRYLGKAPDQLSDSEIARGFKISGILHGYTVFDTRLMDEAVRRYQISSVYDPCSGWGERALYCKSHGDMRYLGIDINEKLFSGYDRMRAGLGMSRQAFLHGDSASINLSGRGEYDAVLTCPPYGNTEIYSPGGSENLSEPDFLEWWAGVVKNSMGLNPSYFCFQINTAWRGKMLHVLQSFGFELIDELALENVPSSHFTRKNGTSRKTSQETMLILRNPFHQA